VNGIPLTIIYESARQINAFMPATLTTGLAQLNVHNPAGSQTLSLYIEPIFPSVFTIGQPW